MPPKKRQAIGRVSTLSKKKKIQRATETKERHNIRLYAERERQTETRATEATEVRATRLCYRREQQRTSTTQETPEKRATRQDNDRERQAASRALQSTEKRTDRLHEQRSATAALRQRQQWSDLRREAFNYDSQCDYSSHPQVTIGNMDVTCASCQAQKFEKETPGMCCANGKIHLPPLNNPPEPLLSLTSAKTTQSKIFLQNIRKYNSCFQMTSFGATKVVDEHGFMPTFKIQGQIYHRAGSLLPLPNKDPQFLQIYFIGDNELETERRCSLIPGLDRDIVRNLQVLLHERNALVRIFKTSLDQMPTDEYTVVLKADRTPRGEHERRFNAPTTNEVAIVIVGQDFERRDIVIQKRCDTLHRISETHRSYDSLQYPLIFWEGDDGYHFNMKQVNPTTGISTNKKVSAMDFYAYRIMIRPEESNHVLRCGKLFQQFVVDMYAKIESERLLFIRLNQKKLRVDDYIHLRDAVSNDRNAADLGQMVILPSTFQGSPRYMHEYAQDAMTYVRTYGRPDLFITFTCNPTWEEIKELLFSGQTPPDRHDITARVFKQKLTKLMNVITKSHIYGETRCWMYSIEWQKRGLPHAHILIWLKDRIHLDTIDTIISAELPDPQEDPVLFKTISTSMIHGPCGALNPTSPCMKDGKCTKKYPRDLKQDTYTNTDGYPEYRRRKPGDGGHTAIIRVRNADVEVDNRWVVPYSPLLSKMFQAHINVEFCNSVKSIKYICKYINKGSDMAVFEIASGNNNIDEVTQFQMGRYISSNEAVWRILSFPIHDRHPTVVHLSVHLENGQRVYFTENNAQDRAARPQNTTLTAFFQLCQEDEFAKTLLYFEVPTYYTWNTTHKQFRRRKQGATIPGYNVMATDALGRVYTVHPNNAECYYLRMLLHTIKGPTSFASLRTVDGEVCETYREACQRLGLLEDDQHWDTTLSDAAMTCLPRQLRTLFAIILTTCAPSNPQTLWNSYKESLSEDILHQARRRNPDVDIGYSLYIFNTALIHIEDKCIAINNKTLQQLGLRSPTREGNDTFDRDILREQNYDVNKLQTFVTVNEPLLVDDQKFAYESIMTQVVNDKGGLIFLDAPGGTGKTFVINLLLATIRKEKGIALAVASSGIAATLLEGGRTAHSALKLPFNLALSETPICSISKSSGQATVLKTCKLIVWDECTMAHKKSVEALDRTLQDLRGKRQPMGGALLLLAGDFRQTLPVIKRSTPADELNACLKASYLWRHVQKLTLSTNMRVHLQKDDSAGKFAEQLLQIGDGTFPVDHHSGDIIFPPDFCTVVSSVTDLIDKVFPGLSNNFKDHQWLRNRAILAPKNDNANTINIQILNSLPGDATTYKSIDTTMQEDQSVHYPIEFLNSLELPGVPPHKLILKIGSPIILLRNIDPPKLCNGTRLAVKDLRPNVIEATILTGNAKGENVFIPRIPIIPTDIPFEFKRLQFPVRLAFAMTINKSQGQSLQVAGINLENPCFSHGQLYVACSRVGKPSNLYIFAQNGTTKNIVYPTALNS